MNWRKVKIGNIVVLLREDFHYFSFDICCVIGQKFQDGEISRFTITIVSNQSKRAYNLEQTVILHLPPRYQHQAQGGTLRWVVGDCMLQSSKWSAYLSTTVPKLT